MDGRREMGRCTYTFVPETALGDQLEVFWPDPFSWRRKGIDVYSPGTGELLS